MPLLRAKNDNKNQRPIKTARRQRPVVRRCDPRARASDEVPVSTAQESRVRIERPQTNRAFRLARLESRANSIHTY